MRHDIYLDNGATTSLSKEVINEISPYIYEEYGNPSSNYSFSLKSREAIDKARRIIAEYLGVNKNEIYFTSGGSESDNWAIKGIALANREKGNHIITTKIEHHAVLNSCKYLENLGFDVTYINVDENGVVNLNELESAIKPETILISVMFANNEIGTIEPIKEIGEIAEKHNIIFHTDAVQAYGHIDIKVKEYKIHALSASAHKINGPKGIGILYLKNNVNIDSLIHGGEQERNKRAGTYNTFGIVGFGKATEIAKRDLIKVNEYERKLRDYFIERLINEVDHVKLNGHRIRRLSNNINISFKDLEGESIKILLDKAGIYVSTGSACTSTSKRPSHVLKAIGSQKDYIGGTIRLTISKETTEEEIDYVIDEIKKIINKLRNINEITKN